MSTATARIAIAVCLAGAAGSSLGQPVLQGPVRAVVPFPPGGGLDLVARTVAEKLSERWKQSIVIDNRPGASGTIGAAIAAKAQPDGRTILFASSSTVAVVPALRRQSAAEAVAHLTPVSLLSRVPYVLVTHPSVPAGSVAELIKLAKSQPGRLNYASSGNGSASHLAMELLKFMAAVDLTHVPYKGSSPAVIDLIGGQIQTAFNNIVSSQPHIRSGRLRALGVSGPVRSHVLPDVPTIAESGLGGYEALQWYGLLLPAGASAELVRRMHADVVAVLELPEVRERLTREGGDVFGTAPAQFMRHLKSEIDKWTKVVVAANIRVE